ncbi:MAG: Ig-like domain-containing protein [Phenylobacterium sp.]
MRTPTLALIAGLMSAPAFAAPAPTTAPTTPAPALSGHEVSPVTVFPSTSAPKIVKSYPASGQALQAGILVLTVTFDQPMVKSGFDFGAAPGAPALACLKTPRLLDDAKTFVLLCTSQPNTTYNLTFNARPQGGFENVAEHRAEPATLSFKTTDGDGAEDIHQAMKNAGLREIDVPIQDTPDLPPAPPPKLP